MKTFLWPTKRSATNRLTTGHFWTLYATVNLKPLDTGGAVFHFEVTNQRDDILQATQAQSDIIVSVASCIPIWPVSNSANHPIGKPKYNLLTVAQLLFDLGQSGITHWLACKLSLSR